MNGYLPKKRTYSLNPGQPEVVFSHAANHFITMQELIGAQDHFAQITRESVVYIEDRRLKTREKISFDVIQSND